MTFLLAKVSRSIRWTHLKATHSNSRNITKLIINTTQLRNWETQRNTTQQKIKLTPNVAPKKSNQNRNRNQMIQIPNIHKHPKNASEWPPPNGAAAYPPTALALPWTFPTAPAVGQRRRLRAAVADHVAEEGQGPQRCVLLQPFCQSLRPPRNGTRWKRWRREGGGCGVPTPHFQWILPFW